MTGGALGIAPVERFPAGIFVKWLLVGLVIYVFYGRRHSRLLQHGETVVSEQS